jgi:hypothetical protein
VKPPLLIHLHIPRTGGTTLSRLIRLKLMAGTPAHWLRRSNVFGFEHVHQRERVAHLKSRPERERRRVHFFQAHMGYGVHAFLPRPAAYVTVLRDPVARVISALAYGQQTGRLPADEDLEACILGRIRSRARNLDNLQVRCLAGEDGELAAAPFGRCTRTMLEVARARIDGDLLLTGLTERFDETVILLRRRLGWTSCYYCVSNVAKRRRHGQRVSSELIDKIRELNALDLELYAHARDRLQERIDREGASFARELDRFRRINRYYDRCLRPVYNLLPAGRVLANRIERLGWRPSSLVAHGS